MCVIDFWKFAYGVQGKIGLPCLSWGASGKSNANSFPYLGDTLIIIIDKVDQHESWVGVKTDKLEDFQ